MDRKIKQKINKETEDLNTINQIDLTDIHRTFHPTIGEYTFFSRGHRIFSWKDHKLGHETNINKSERAKVIQSVFSNQNEIKSETKNRRKFGEFTGNEGSK